MVRCWYVVRACLFACVRQSANRYLSAVDPSGAVGGDGEAPASENRWERAQVIVGCGQGRVEFGAHGPQTALEGLRDGLFLGGAPAQNNVISGKRRADVLVEAGDRRVVPLGDVAAPDPPHRFGIEHLKEGWQLSRASSTSKIGGWEGRLPGVEWAWRVPGCS